MPLGGAGGVLPPWSTRLHGSNATDVGARVRFAVAPTASASGGCASRHAAANQRRLPDERHLARADFPGSSASRCTACGRAMWAATPAAARTAPWCTIRWCACTPRAARSAWAGRGWSGPAPSRWWGGAFGELFRLPDRSLAEGVAIDLPLWDLVARLQGLHRRQPGAPAAAAGPRDPRLRVSRRRQPGAQAGRHRQRRTGGGRPARLRRRAAGGAGRRRRVPYRRRLRLAARQHRVPADQRARDPAPAGGDPRPCARAAPAGVRLHRGGVLAHGG